MGFVRLISSQTPCLVEPPGLAERLATGYRPLIPDYCQQTAVHRKLLA
jgi:hypothetical protein